MSDATPIEHDFHVFEPGGQRDAVEKILSAYGLVKNDLHASVVDPFGAGTELDVEKAEWFMSLYDLAGGEEYRGHLRDLHYKVNALRPDLYDASDEAWGKLMGAKRLAFVLGLLRPDALDDRSIARSTIQPRDGIRIRVGMGEIAVPDRGAGRFVAPCFASMSPAIACPIDLLVWVEKPSPMIEEEVDPACARYGVDVHYGRGAPGQTFVGHRARAAASKGREFVLIALSDADFSGSTMARSLAKTVEILYRGGLIEDLPRMRVVRAGLTLEQVAEVEATIGRDIPRSVGPKGDLRVELQALPAFVPGELGRIVEETIVSVVGDFEETARRWTEDLDADLASSDAAADLKALHGEYEELLTSPEYVRIREQLEVLEQRRGEIVEALFAVVADADLPEIDEPETDWLLDTDRSFIEQAQAYRRHEGIAPLPFVLRACEVCGGPVTGDARRKNCSPACTQRAKHMKRKGLPFKLPEVECAWCGEPFQPKRRDSPCCCEEHRIQFKNSKRVRQPRGTRGEKGAAP